MSTTDDLFNQIKNSVSENLMGQLNKMYADAFDRGRREAFEEMELAQKYPGSDERHRGTSTATQLVFALAKVEKLEMELAQKYPGSDERHRGESTVRQLVFALAEIAKLEAKLEARDKRIAELKGELNDESR